MEQHGMSKSIVRLHTMQNKWNACTNEWTCIDNQLHTWKSIWVLNFVSWFSFSFYLCCCCFIPVIIKFSWNRHRYIQFIEIVHIIACALCTYVFNWHCLCWGKKKSTDQISYSESIWLQKSSEWKEYGWKTLNGSSFNDDDDANTHWIEMNCRK